jgi:hypothetical protein
LLSSVGAMFTKFVANDCPGMTDQRTNDVLLYALSEVKIGPCFIPVLNGRQFEYEVMDILNVALSLSFVPKFRSQYLKLWKELDNMNNVSKRFSLGKHNRNPW